MSYSIQEAKAELEHDIFIALETRDSEALRNLAERLDADEAEVLLDTAKKIDLDDMAYDEFNNN